MIQVYRICSNFCSKYPNKYYAWCEAAPKVEYYRDKKGNLESKHYANPDQIEYLGKFIRDRTEGFGDGSQYFMYFETNEGKIREIAFNYEGTTCLLPVKYGTVDPDLDDIEKEDVEKYLQK